MDVPNFQQPPWLMVIRPRWYSQCLESIALRISVSHPFINVQYCVTHELGFVTGKKRQTIPWGKLVKDPFSWISDECIPDGFEWKDPSKIQIGEVFRLLYHWRDREDHDLVPLIWIPSCPLLQDTEEPLKPRRNLRQARAHQPQESDDENFDLPKSDDSDGESSNESFAKPNPPDDGTSDNSHSQDSSPGQYEHPISILH